MKQQGCICLPNDPCDYHLATCTTCHPRCTGHNTIRLGDVSHGLIFILPSNKGVHFLKLRDQKAVNLSTNALVSFDQNVEVEVLGSFRYHYQKDSED